MAYATITGLNIYPVKSCRGIALEEATLGITGFKYDRHWMITNEAGRFLSQKDLPRLAGIVPSITEHGLSLVAPGKPALHVPLDAGSAVFEVTVLFDRCPALDVGDDAARWLSEFLERPVRLVRFDPDATRPVHPQFYTGDVDAKVEFPDAFPLLIVSQASLDDLNKRVATPVPMSRFRPSIVVEGLEPYEEDRIHELVDGSIKLQMARPCTRCKITTVDQLTGVVTGDEPLKTLRSYRFNKELPGVMFGQYAVVAGGSSNRLYVGQRLEIDRKHHSRT